MCRARASPTWRRGGRQRATHWKIEQQFYTYLFFKRHIAGRGGKGPFTVAEAYMGDDVLAPRS